MLQRLICRGVTNVLAMLRLLPMSNRDEVEILAPRHQITVLQRQLGKERVQFIPEGSGIPGGATAQAATAAAGGAA
ncbi:MULTISPECIES: hypothetical protein [unclassified Streptomyces]|uniref:hypothetical protein n=1 Tax=unclassified Streptomyces TaxID=2593676 RepID=UPI002E16C802